MEGAAPPPNLNFNSGPSPSPSSFDVKQPYHNMRPPPSSAPYGAVNVPRMPEHRPKTEHDQYIEQKAAEVAQSENVDMGQFSVYFF
uniref:Uncharacterized protein n=1 Tax=Panagrolaimus sp. ES5 TaxID=591445 RepID=A0AC34FUT0_9BILA